jgi:hypothetical protein
MSITLQPQVAFPLTRQIANHLDTTVYYVRAVVRNALGTIIDTVDLASQGEQRYQTSWRVPADPSGQGAYISIVTSVYTDSGYTTKSEAYGDEETTYLVFDRVMPAMRGGGGVDYFTVRRIIKEELENLPKPEPITFPSPVITPAPVMRLDDVLTAINDLKKALKPKQPIVMKEVDLSPILAAIKEKEVTKAPDLAPILKWCAEKDEDDNLNRQELLDNLTELKMQLEKGIPEIIEKEEEKPILFDLSKLSV